MKRLFNRKHNLIVMDGSSTERLCSVMVKLGDIIGRGIVRVSRLDGNHPTMFVMEYQTGLLNHLKIKKELENSYPGLCIHDVAV